MGPGDLSYPQAFKLSTNLFTHVFSTLCNFLAPLPQVPLEFNIFLF